MHARKTEKKIFLALIFLSTITASTLAFPYFKEDAVILTPKPGPAPRINGAKISASGPARRSCSQSLPPEKGR